MAYWALDENEWKNYSIRSPQRCIQSHQTATYLIAYTPCVSNVRITHKPACGFAVSENISFISEEGPLV